MAVAPPDGRSETMIAAARRNAESAKVAIEFVVGSMTALPHRAGSFDVVLCLWTAFYELLLEHEQETALRETWRVQERDWGGRRRMMLTFAKVPATIGR